MPDAPITALDLVLELTVLLGDDMRRGLGELGLTETKAHLVFAVQHAGPTTQRVLADALGVTPRTVTTLVDELGAAGVVAREPHPTDRRATLVTLTQDGAALGAGLVAGQGELAGRLFAGLDEDLPAFTRVLGEVVARLRALTEESA